MALTHKYLHKEKQEMFTLAGTEGRARTRQTAGTKALTAQFAKSDIWKNSFAVRVVDPWNKLPDSARQETKQELFKRQLKKAALNVTSDYRQEREWDSIMTSTMD